MPAHPMPLKPKEPAKRAPGIHDGLWYFPRNLADQANARGLSAAQIAAMAGVSPSKVSRWMSYNTGSLLELKLSEVMALEAGMELPHGTLSLPPVPFVAKRRA